MWFKRERVVLQMANREAMYKQYRERQRQQFAEGELRRKTMNQQQSKVGEAIGQELDYETNGYRRTFVEQVKKVFTEEMDYYKRGRVGLGRAVTSGLELGGEKVKDTLKQAKEDKVEGQYERIVIADVIPDPHNPYFVSVAMVYANDLEAKYNDPRMVNEPTGNYVRFRIDDYNEMMARANTSGDLPVIDAPVTKYNDRTSFIQWGKGKTPTDPFDFAQHEKNTPNGTVLESTVHGTRFQFSKQQELENNQDYEYEP